MIIDDEAREELLAAATWYDDQRAGLGDELLDAVGIVLGVPCERPQRLRHVLQRRLAEVERVGDVAPVRLGPLFQAERPQNFCLHLVHVVRAVFDEVDDLDEAAAQDAGILIVDPELDDLLAAAQVPRGALSLSGPTVPTRRPAKGFDVRLERPLHP